MFFCEPCRVKNGWPEGFGRSLGACEVCGERTSCHDVHSARLASPPAPPAPEVIQLRLTLRHPDYCDDCQFDISGCGHCQIWGKQGARGPAIPGSKGGAQYLRLPECVAARKGGES